MKTMSVTLAFKMVEPESAWTSKAIGLWTKSKTYHVEMCVNKTWVSVYDDAGVKLKDVKPFKDTWEYISFKDFLVTDEQYLIFTEFLQKQDGKSYDMLGIALAQIFPLRVHSHNKWTCSELVTKLLQMLYFEDVMELDPITVTPGELLRIYDKVY